MSKFIEVHDTIINTDDVRRIEFLGDDVYLGIFPKGSKGDIIVDCISFDFAKIVTFDGNTYLLSIDLYPTEVGQTEDEWININRAYISETMIQINELLSPIKLTGKEYEL